MGSIVTRLALFLSSYFPLFLIFFTLFVATERVMAISLLGIGILGLIVLAIYLKLVRRLAPLRVKVQELRRRDGEAINYIVSYVIPFFAFYSTSWQQRVAILIFFLVVSILYVNSNMIHINPMLNLAGYHIYEIKVEDGGFHSLITRRRVVLGDTLEVVKVGEDILVEKEHGEAEAH